MAGEMTLQNPFNVGFTRVDGSEMRVTGDLNIDGVVGVGGDLHLDNPATITFDHASSLLFTRASTLVAPNANFVGPGTLANVTGDMTLSDGVDLNDVSLENYGRLNLGSDTGLVVVPEFENMASGIFEIDIGGFNLGSERDVLLVGGGGAQLAGTLEVNLVDAGNGLFLPEIGDEFAFLISPGDILGMFANAPVSFAAGQHFYWDVEYNPNDVTLRVSSIGVPEPASLFWLTLLGSGTLFYRRRTADSAGL